MNLNFKPQFVDAILDEKKIHTLRYGKRWKVGDKIHFYTGLRTKGERLFAKGVVKDIYASFDWCKECERFLIHPITGQAYVKNILGGKMPSGQREFLDLVAKNDGFKDFSDMKKFFLENGKEGSYQLIVWEIEEKIYEKWSFKRV